MDDPDVVLNLRCLNGSQRQQYETFWGEVQKFLQEDVGLAAEKQRHSEITHLVRAISLWDLLEQVSARCPPGMFDFSHECLLKCVSVYSVHNAIIYKCTCSALYKSVCLCK